MARGDISMEEKEIKRFKLRPELKKLQREIFKNKKQFEKCMNNFLLELQYEAVYYHNECKRIEKMIKLCSSEGWIK